MIYTFKDGTTKEFTFGMRVHGLKHNNQRPLTLSIDVNEIIDYLNKDENNKYRIGAYVSNLKMTLAISYK